MHAVKSGPRRLDGHRLKAALQAAASARRRALQDVVSSPRVVFISYAHPNREVAARLARYLRAHGIVVWWDRNLAGGEHFRSKIQTVIETAQAVVVIWSADAVKSDFVLDEASRARKAGKLIPTCIKGFDLDDIPYGFGQLHTQDVGKRNELLRALSGLGISSGGERT